MFEKINKILNFENIGFALILVNFFVGDLIFPTSIELRWIIITLCFVWAINKRLKDLEKKIEESKNVE